MRGFYLFAHIAKISAMTKAIGIRLKLTFKIILKPNLAISICPECAKKFFSDMDIYDDNGEVAQD